MPQTPARALAETIETPSLAPANVPLDAINQVKTEPTLQTNQLPDGTLDAEAQTRVTSASRIVIVFLTILTNLLQYISMFATVAAGFKLSSELGREPGPGQANWMAAAYSLTQSTFVLISGRLGAVYGHQKLLLLGVVIVAIFSLMNAFCTTYNSFVAARALTGIGGGIIMPNAVATLTIMEPPGRTRNITLAFFATSPPVGALIGALFAGVLVEHTHWKWLFICIAVVSAALFVALVVALPREDPVDNSGSIDYMGALLGLSALVLFNFAWNQAPSVGWKTSYVIIITALSVLTFIAFLAWESKFAQEPIMPLSVFKAPTFTALIFVVLMTYMSFGISLWYMVAWQQLLRHWSVLHLAAGWSPFCVGASMAVGLAAWLIPRLQAQYIMAIGVLTCLVSNLLLATMPERQIYWAQTFPAILIGSICPDFVYVAAQIIASNSVGKREQGVAGSLIGTLNLYGVSLGLGFAGTVEVELVKNGASDVEAYRAALYFGAALALTALILDLGFVRMPKDER